MVLTLPVVVYSAAPFFRQCLARSAPAAPGWYGRAGGAWGRCRFHRKRLGHRYGIRRGLFTGDDVRLFLLGGRLSNAGAPEGGQRDRSAGQADAGIGPKAAGRLSGEQGNRADRRRIFMPAIVVLVRPGESIPPTVSVVEGRQVAVKALLTGEPAGGNRRGGDRLTGGSTPSPLVMRVEQAGGKHTLSAIVRLMGVQRPKPRIVPNWPTAFATRFVAALLFAAVAVAIGWYFVDPNRRYGSPSVLVVTRPRALSLATPVTLTVASGELARAGCW